MYIGLNRNDSKWAGLVLSLLFELQILSGDNYATLGNMSLTSCLSFFAKLSS